MKSPDFPWLFAVPEWGEPASASKRNPMFTMAYVSRLTEEERVNTLNRMEENRNVVLWVQGSLQERAASYRVALERMVIAAPSPVAVEAERALNLLNQRLAAYSA